MRLSEAEKRINKISRKRFSTLFSDSELEDIIQNKGLAGQLLEKAVGLQLSNTTLDFSDGELKSYKCDMFGNPKETIAITMISSTIDDFLQKPPIPFEQTHLYQKIKNCLFVPVYKDGHPANWQFLPSVTVSLVKPRNIMIKRQLKTDYIYICKQMQLDIEHGLTKHISTTKGEYLEIRTKDSKPYHPIYSSLYGREVSTKSYAFYFTKKYLRKIHRMSRFSKLKSWLYGFFHKEHEQ